MTYATQQALIDRFGTVELAQLTDRTNGTVIDAAVLGRALDDADAEIDGYLATRYQLPLASPPAVLVRLAADIARYRLYDDRTTEAVRQRYDDAVKLLSKIAKGEVTLDTSVLVAPVVTDNSAVLSRTSPKVFSASALSGY